MRSLQWYKRGAAYFFRVKGGWRVVKRRAHSSPYQNNSYTSPYATPVKGEECFWKWRIIVTSYSDICVNLWNLRDLHQTPNRSNICVHLWNLWDIKEWNLWDIKSKLSAIRWIKYPGKANDDTGMPIRPTENKKVDFQQKIHLLHYILRFVHLFSVYFVYFCGCVWIAARSNFQKLRLHATSK